MCSSSTSDIFIGKIFSPKLVQFCAADVAASQDCNVESRKCFILNLHHHIKQRETTADQHSSHVSVCPPKSLTLPTSGMKQEVEPSLRLMCWCLRQIGTVVLSRCWCLCVHDCVCLSVCSGLVQWIRGAAAVTKPIRASSSTCLLISPCLTTTVFKGKISIKLPVFSRRSWMFI